MAEVRKRGAKKKTYRMPEKLPKGEILTDTNKTCWVLNKSIGVGGFGEIYDAIKSGEPKKCNYVIKIEPMENGPLFCERAVYLNIGKQEQIAEFVRLKTIKKLGMPAFYGFGSHSVKTIEYRFIVIERLGQNLWSIFEDCKKKFSIPTILKISVQILYVLEYMHSKGYAHCDIKGGNLLLGEGKGNENQVHLVDFGLACKFTNEFKPNPKKAHDGTLEYTSRDLHKGVPTRRGDLEILAYNMLQWATSQLPWEHLKKPAEVEQKKEELMANPKQLITTCFGPKSSSHAIADFVVRVSKLDVAVQPDYDKLRQILVREINSLASDMNKLEFLDVSPARSQSESPMKTARGKPKKELTKTASSDDISTVKVDKRKNNVNVAKKVTSKSPKKKQTVSETPTTPKRSWRDFPTIVNGAKMNSNEPPEKKNKL